MKKQVIITMIFIIILVFGVGAMIHSFNTKNELSNTFKSSGVLDSKSSITKDMAYEGVYNYCHSVYDWSIAEDNPSIMYVEMGDETESEYQLKFRSYTGTFVYFYVDKSSGITKLIEYVPTLDVKNEAGTINIFDYLRRENV